MSHRRISYFRLWLHRKNFLGGVHCWCFLGIRWKEKICYFFVSCQIIVTLLPQQVSASGLWLANRVKPLWQRVSPQKWRWKACCDNSATFLTRGHKLSSNNSCWSKQSYIFQCGNVWTGLSRPELPLNLPGYIYLMLWSGRTCLFLRVSEVQ